MNDRNTDVIIVGGGPVGLFLGCLLLQNGISCRVLEKRRDPSTLTRSIGIHPPALERLAEVDIADELIEKGICVTEGLAFAGSRRLGTLSFNTCPAPYPFILVLPQFITEAVLERRLLELDDLALQHGLEVTDIAENADEVVVTASKSGQSEQFRAKYVVGCDGKESQVRKSAKIDFPGVEYPDKFLMGDFEDTTDLASRAGIYLTDNGVIESFPLPGNVRRWVVKTDRLLDSAQPDLLTEMVLERTNNKVEAGTCSMISAFSVHHHLAARMARGRILLAGDSAHLISPIGGQGMNLGWLDAWAAFSCLEQSVQGNVSHEPLFSDYSKARRRAARRVRRRAEFNMWMGRTSRFQFLKYNAVQAALRTRAMPFFARRFSMRGI